MKARRAPRQPAVRLAADAVPRDLHARLSGLDGRGRPRDRRLKPDSWKGYTIGDNTNKDLSTHPWRMDDEKLVYPFYEKFVKAGYESSASTRACIRPRRSSTSPTSRATPTSRRRQGGQGLAAAQLHHLSLGVSLHRRARRRRTASAVRPDRPGRWVSDLAEIPASTASATSTATSGRCSPDQVVEPRLSAALMGTLIKGLGADHVVWGTDAFGPARRNGRSKVCVASRFPRTCSKNTASPPLGPADGPVKRAIFGENSARMYRYEIKKAASRDDRFASVESNFERRGRDPWDLARLRHTS